MIIKYDFSENIDLTDFKQQVPEQICAMRELSVHVLVGDYRLNIEFVTSDDSDSHMMTMWLLERHKRMEAWKVILPRGDSRFKELENIKKVFGYDHYKAWIASSDSTSTIHTLCGIIKLLHRINKLAAFA